MKSNRHQGLTLHKPKQKQNCRSACYLKIDCYETLHTLKQLLAMEIVVGEAVIF